MKRPSINRDNIATLLFSLTDEGVRVRNTARTLAGLAVWLILSFITMLLTMYNTGDTQQRIIIVAMSMLKYLPIMMVAYTLAKTKAAYYLADVFELEDPLIAEQFIEEVAFGEGIEMVTINEGRISEKDERSPIILIGGPGRIKVNLGSAALLEKVNGEPEVIYASSKPWKIGRFERIREIGKNDEVGKREYAAINLRDQFVSGLSVKSRTKDGIPIEARDIKIIFSILRKNQANTDAPDGDPYSFEMDAVKNLVYKQTIITPPPSTPSGVTFPWDTTVIPLVIYQLEKIITSNPLSEILATVSQKEIDYVVRNEQTMTQKLVEMTGAQMNATLNNNLPPNFMSRTLITSQFFSQEFQETAAKMGVAVHWIDIGTWYLPPGPVLDNLKNASSLARDNIKRRGALNKQAKKLEMDGVIELLHSVVFSAYDRNSSSRRSESRDVDMSKFTKFLEANPDVPVTPELFRQFSHQSSPSKRVDSLTIAVGVLKAIRQELIAARALIAKEEPTPEVRAELAAIDKALLDINYHVPHYITKGH